jgi:hypothetical protein
VYFVDKKICGVFVRFRANAQWNSLPNYLEGSLERFIPVVDTSGSMFWETAKISGDLYAGHVAMSLGMYISERKGCI